MLQPAAEGDRAEPVEPGEYNAIRRRLLEGAPAVDYPEELIRYQQGMGRLSGGGLYRLSVDGAEGCAAAEYTDGESVLFKELLLSPDKMGGAGTGTPRGALLCAHPCPVGWHEG